MQSLPAESKWPWLVSWQLDEGGGGNDGGASGGGGKYGGSPGGEAGEQQ